MFTVEALALVTVTVTGDELPPTTVLATLKVLGEKVRGAVAPPDPVPERVANCVGNDALETARLPSAVPLAVGVNVTLTVHFAFLASVPLQGLFPLPAAA
jgi:hypothetical protein